ncbi:T9SS type A sorting domain-containing protein [candidate division KSB1 bacterium]|nr:T9SS type A sorting domain-containing protein [candidate division KSB1 bacterium]
MYQNFPNPFNRSTIIPYRLFRQANKASLHIYNALGRELQRFENLNTLPGSFRAIWDGLDNAQKPVSSGIYYYELRVDHRAESKRMIFLR